MTLRTASSHLHRDSRQKRNDVGQLIPYLYIYIYTIEKPQRDKGLYTLRVWSIFLARRYTRASRMTSGRHERKKTAEVAVLYSSCVIDIIAATRAQWHNPSRWHSDSLCSGSSWWWLWLYTYEIRYLWCTRIIYPSRFWKFLRSDTSQKFNHVGTRTILLLFTRSISGRLMQAQPAITPESINFSLSLCELCGDDFLRRFKSVTADDVDDDCTFARRLLFSYRAHARVASLSGCSSAWIRVVMDKQSCLCACVCIMYI